VTAALREEISALALTRGDLPFRRGDPVAHVHFVVQGEVLALHHLSDGSEAVMQRACGGEFFAQSAVQLPRFACNARVTGATKAARLPVEALNAALAIDADLARAWRGQQALGPRRQRMRAGPLRLQRATGCCTPWCAKAPACPARGCRRTGPANSAWSPRRCTERWPSWRHRA
jgi:CRP-like cAMP-binding protein